MYNRPMRKNRTDKDTTTATDACIGLSVAAPVAAPEETPQDVPASVHTGTLPQAAAPGDTRADGTADARAGVLPQEAAPGEAHTGALPQEEALPQGEALLQKDTPREARVNPSGVSKERLRDSLNGRISYLCRLAALVIAVVTFATIILGQDDKGFVVLGLSLSVVLLSIAGLQNHTRPRH